MTRLVTLFIFCAIFALDLSSSPGYGDISKLYTNLFGVNMDAAFIKKNEHSGGLYLKKLHAEIDGIPGTEYFSLPHKEIDIEMPHYGASNQDYMERIDSNLKYAINNSDTIITLTHLGTTLDKKSVPHILKFVFTPSILELMVSAESIVKAQLKLFRIRPESDLGHSLIQLRLMDFETKWRSPRTTSKLLDRDRGWLSIDATNLLRVWAGKQSPDFTWLTQLEVTDSSDMDLGQSNVGLHLNVPTLGRIQPFLVLFLSTDRGGGRKKRNQSHDMYDRMRKVHDTVHKSPAVEESQLSEHLPARVNRFEPCRRKKLVINFNELGLDSWVMFPPEVDIGDCSGDCRLPLTTNATNHGILREIAYHNDGELTSRTHCVARSYKHLDILYNANSDITVLRRFPQLIAESCGCA